MRRRRVASVLDVRAADLQAAARDAARDAVYIAVGLGVLGFQRAQVRRRELQQHVDALLGRSAAPQRDARASS
jgi:hypothetical protein